MTAPSWVTPNTRLFLVAYEGADGRPYAVAVSDHGVAARLARRFGGEVIDTVVDNHADMAAYRGFIDDEGNQCERIGDDGRRSRPPLRLDLDKYGRPSPVA